MAALGEISNVYDDDPYSKFATLSGAQANQSLQAGDQAAKYADPFAAERQKQIQNLETLQSNPGSIETSPFYKFLMDTQLNAVRASNAAKGLTNSGRGAMALQDRAAGVASQAYFPLLQNASTLAMSGSSPTAAGLAYSNSVNRSQDQQQAAAAARAAGQSKPPQAPASPMTTSLTPQSSGAPVAPSYGLPSGGYYGGISGQVDAGTPGYTPSANAGTGYVSSGGNTTNFGYDPYTDPSYGPGVANDVLGPQYDASADYYGSDYGNGDFGSY